METQERIPVELLSFPEWHNKPFRLNRYELENPMKVLERYHADYSLPEIRAAFRELIWDADVFKKSTGGNRLGFKEETEKLIEAAFWMCEQGMVGLDPTLGTNRILLINENEKQVKHNAFLTHFFREFDCECLDMRILLDKIETYKLPEKGIYGPQTENDLLQAKVVAWQTSCAQRSLEMMIDQYENKSYDLSLVPETLQTASFINRCARPFDDFKPALDRDFAVRIDPHIQTSIICDKDKLTTIIQNLLHIAFNFCPTGGFVQLVCNPLSEAICITITFAEQTSPIGKQEIFPAYEAFGDSAFAGTYLYTCKVLTDAIKGNLTCYCDQKQTYFKLMVPINVANK